MFGLDGREDRQRIRALRATPVGRAARDDARKLVFTSSLGQFDELLTGAASVGPSTRPLLLYYALNQAGRAIAAANIPDGDRWEPLLHGLKVRDGDGISLQEISIHPDPGRQRPDSFSTLCVATGSSTLNGPTTIARLWAAIPFLDMPGLGAGAPKAMAAALPVVGSPTTASVQIDQPLPDTAEARARVSQWICDEYPVAAGEIDVLTLRPDPGDPAVRGIADVCWRGQDGNALNVYLVLDRYLGGRGSAWLIPAVTNERDVLRPLQMWWCLLYALSHVARYRPAIWTASLDADASRLAVPIESALQDALEVVPRLVLLALRPSAVKAQEG